MDFINYKFQHMLARLWIHHLSLMLGWDIIVFPRYDSLFQVFLIYLVYRESCQLGKHIRSLFLSSVSQCASSPFSLIHSDIWGSSPRASSPKGRFGPTTRVMAKRIQEDWNAATNGRETLLYMFKCHKL